MDCLGVSAPYGLNTTAGILNSKYVGDTYYYLGSTTGERILDSPGGKAEPEETKPIHRFYWRGD